MYVSSRDFLSVRETGMDIHFAESEIDSRRIERSANTFTNYTTKSVSLIPILFIC